jgi:3-oxoacyl-[acyl-carrier protein] reductase
MTAGENDCLRGRTALVTGGGGSLGRAITLFLRDRGCRVIALDRDESGIKKLAAEAGVAIAACDLLDAAQAESRLREIWDANAPISILVNAVGVIHSAPLLDITNPAKRRHSADEWRRVVETNLTALFIATVNVVDRMVATRTRGVVVNLSSISAAGNAGQAAYSAAKAGVNAATLSWAKELGPLGVRFVAIAPGFVDTPSTRAALPEAVLTEWARRTPLRRLGTVEHVTNAVLFAITNEHLTGKVIEIDGGLTL